MFTNNSQNRKCLWLLLLSCIILICIIIVKLETPSPSAFEITFLTPDESGESDVFFNLPNFKYVLEAEPCDNSTFAIMIVTSYAGDVETRSYIRQAYPKNVLSEVGIKRVFLLALIHPNKNINQVEQNAIVNEQERFGDLLQGNFIEDYRNLTYKHVMGLRWAAENCFSSQYVIKMDHDIIFDVFSIITMLRKLPRRRTLLAGDVLSNMKPIRDAANKWFVTEEEYNGNQYPDFLSGWLYITNPLTAKMLWRESHSVPIFWIDDTYVTGILTEKLGLPLVRLNRYFTNIPEQIICCINNPSYYCKYWVGPNGGDNRLIVAFAKKSKQCYISVCKNITKINC